MTDAWITKLTLSVILKQNAYGTHQPTVPQMLAHSLQPQQNVELKANPFWTWQTASETHVSITSEKHLAMPKINVSGITNARQIHAVTLLKRARATRNHHASLTKKTSVNGINALYHHSILKIHVLVKSTNANGPRTQTQLNATPTSVLP